MKILRKYLYKPASQDKNSSLAAKYREQTKKDSDAINHVLKIFVVLFTIVEVLEVVVSETLLKGKIEIDEIFIRLAFSLLIFVFFIGRSFYKSSSFSKQIEKIGLSIFLLVYCGLTTFLLSDRMNSLIDSYGTQRDYFDFMSLGVGLIPNLILSDIIFVQWIHKCIIPVSQILSLTFLAIAQGPLNRAALIFQGLAYSFYIIMIFWMKEKLRWKIFLSRMSASQWNEIHKEILKNVPDNVAVYNFNGEVEFENEFLKKFQKTFEPQRILETIIEIKKRGNFVSTSSIAVHFL